MRHIKQRILIFLVFLITICISNVSAAENINITKIAVKDTSMYIYWDRLVGMTGYNVNVIDSKNNAIEKLIVDKEFNFAEIENYKDKNVKKIEIVGVKKDSSTVTTGYKVQYYNKHPLHIQKVILGAYEDSGYIYPVFNPSLSIKSSNLIINQKTYSVLDGKCKPSWIPNNYTILAEVVLSDGSTVYGTYKGEKINEQNYMPKDIPCAFISRGVSNEAEIVYKINSEELLKVSFYNVSDELINTEEIKKIDGIYKTRLPDNAYIAELSIGQENLKDKIRENGEIQKFEVSKTHIESHEGDIPCAFVSREVNDKIRIAYKINSQELLKVSFYDVSGGLINTEEVKKIDKIYKTALPNSAYIAELSIGQENLVDKIRKNGKIQEFEVSKTHIESHKGENVFEGAVNHEETSSSSLPYEKLKLLLGKETLADIAVNGEVIYKRISDGDVEDLYLPLSVGDNNISIIVYTLDGKTQTKQFIVSYLQGDSGVESLLSAPPEIVFKNDYNNKIVTQNSIVFSGSILGGDILNVNDDYIDLDIDMNFSFKANLEPGSNKFAFNVYSGSTLVYTEVVNVTYQLQDIITNVDTIREVDKQYKYIPEDMPDNNLVNVLAPVESSVPTYEEVLENDVSDLFIPLVAFLAIVILVVVIIIPTILKKKKTDENNEQD